jgi:hypothetical protein
MTGVGTPFGVAVGAAPAGELPGTSEDGSSARACSTSAAVPMKVHTTSIAPRVFALVGIRTLNVTGETRCRSRCDVSVVAERRQGEASVSACVSRSRL